MRTAVLASLLVIGCGTLPEQQAPTDPDGTQQGTPENPVPAKTGPYTVTNTVDFTLEAILPPDAELVVRTLREFSINPAHALITVATDVGLPAVEFIYNVLPATLRDHLEDWINGEIAKIHIAGRPLTEYAGLIADLADTALVQFAVESELAIDGATATHRLTALNLAPAGLDVRLPLTAADNLLTQTPTISVAQGGALAIGEQRFGMSYGDLAWQLINLASQQLFGGDVRTLLGQAANCPKLAQTISDKCILALCVGHETELRSVCEGGLDAIVGFVHDRISLVQLQSLHLASGASRLVDDDGDGVGDRIVDGVWDAELNLGAGFRHAPATFDGVR